MAHQTEWRLCNRSGLVSACSLSSPFLEGQTRNSCAKPGVSKKIGKDFLEKLLTADAAIDQELAYSSDPDDLLC